MEAPPHFSEPVPKKKGIPVWGWVLIVLVAGSCPCVILAAILLPVFSQAKISAQRTAAMRNMRQLGDAALMYCAVNDDLFPPAMDSAKAAQPFLAPLVVRPDVFDSTNPEGGLILGNASLGALSQSRLVSPDQTTMFYDEKPWASKYVVTTADGGVRSVPRTEFEATDHQRAELMPEEDRS